MSAPLVPTADELRAMANRLMWFAVTLSPARRMFGDIMELSEAIRIMADAPIANPVWFCDERGNVTNLYGEQLIVYLRPKPDQKGKR
jgi:hypothetical protein